MKNIYSQFKIDGLAISCERYGSGHINETYLVLTDTGPRYILQRINDHVFPNVANLQHNIAAAGNIGGDLGADAGLHVVTGNGQLVVHMDQEALQRGNGAFLGDGAGGGGHGRLKQSFFTGKFHGRVPFCTDAEEESLLQKKNIIIFFSSYGSRGKN